ncbi:MAG: preprotein translocase subunit SecE [Candidatus Levybacteria bacterium RIFCSPHIGHO2_02_FULL_39_36]|nr:MAG: preprotein translocase subunit SecE [Candidatus Levybacteria bacterium RIFCSPHIGHO2_02_FULL_39_36]OGH35977.1 MAG: preprotein translocase subunit SecE [Candidatus Levybacteria bacterium RIFCSPLOWO2_01_FULL_38_120]OGH48422.1 MAG: preprotein translocase subunit SecE [Candidatus Levybacteria bacterium RIFCSPLOWO2_12_FULL_39_17]HLA03924.1 preprotein translocase subunit SecE [Patescibacteria group bacterium]
MFTFLKEVKSELDKVTWPGSSEVSRLTFIVIGISVLVGIYLGGLDFLFTNLLGILIR